MTATDPSPPRAPTGVVVAALDAFRRAVRPRPRRWLVAITLLVATAATVAVTVGLPPAGRTFGALSDPVQSLTSVVTPLFGILLAHDPPRAIGTRQLAPTLLAATLLAAALGIFAVLACATALAVAGSSAAVDPWRHAGTIALGGVLVQVGAGLVGTGLGLLLRSVVLAFVGSVVLPLGLWLTLGSVDVLRPAQAWLTPYAVARNLLSGSMTAAMWSQWSLVLLIWGVGLNALGAARRRR
jgi:hypothetical protein